ncbi:SRPBCC domain-containing protein [Amycolatopsis sp. CA-230715]|uniref:SRPBCC domain-containing protein n=1 Tax=Amycolatopsis sp. CA-230715 TaxID=2745196 RepID=UPI001C01DC0F|nr:SRPBCC domain-containing protein [Amycolatopsis sp. CA-230715]QWF79115.1 hypothetical protein HUW46_02522 [Amycolatopsis sp. CA-230715]
MSVQVHRVYIKASAQAIWDAITKPEWTAKYGYTGLADFDPKPGGRYVVHPTQEFIDMGITGDLIDGEVVEVEPPSKLVLKWRMLMDPALKEEGFTTLAYEIVETKTAGTRLTVTHDLTGAPGLARMVSGEFDDPSAEPGQNAGGGWTWILSDLKSLLETGSTLA